MKNYMLFVIVCVFSIVLAEMPTKLSMKNLNNSQRDENYQRGTFLIVLSNPNLYDYFFIDDINFADLKLTQGYDVDFISFSNSNEDVEGINGSTAQDLKDFIVSYYEEDPMLEFVLLVGDVNQNSNIYNIPTFTILSYNEDEPDQTDYPYTYFGSTDNQEDVFSPNFFIGRWSIGNPTDLINIIARNVVYNKLDPQYISDPGYLNNALVVAGNYSGEGSLPSEWPVTPVWTSKWVQGELEQYGYEQVDSAYFHKGNYEWATINPQIETSWNSGVGIINYRGWGDARGWHKPEFHNSEVTDLLPSFDLPVVLSFVCNTGDFGNESQQMCFGETLITAGTPTAPRGAVAMVGPSDLDTDTRFNNVMCAAMWDALLEDRESQLGPALHQGKRAVHYEFKDLEVNDTHIGEFYHHVYGVLGDPSIDIWLGEPSNMSYSFDSNELHNSFINLSVYDSEGNPLSMAVGAVIYNGDLIGKGVSNQDGLLVIEFETIPNGSEIQVYLNASQYYQQNFSMTFIEDLGDDPPENDFIEDAELEEYGYQMIHSDMDSPNAPVYSWFDLHQQFAENNPNVYNLGLTDDSVNESVPIGFNFQYYGETYDNLIVCSNGWASFIPCVHPNGCVDGNGNSIVSPYFYNNSITCPIGPYGMLAPFYDDLDDNDGQLDFNVYSYSDVENERLIIQWNELANGQVDEQCPDGDNCATETFQLILQARDGTDGDIIFQYNDVSDVDDHGCTIGIESPDKNEGLEYLFFNDYADGYPQLSNNSALLFTVSECLANGDINGDGNLDVLDVEQIISHMLFDDFVDSQQCVSNMNNDSNVDVLDIVLIINIILS